MRKNIVACIMGLLGLGAQATAQEEVAYIDPKNILFSVPTLSNDIPELQKISVDEVNKSCVFHEDDWAQVEFFPKVYLPEIQKILIVYKEHELKNRTNSGWKNVYIRKVTRELMFKGNDALKEFSDLVQSKPGPAPTIISGGGVPTTYKNGFSLPIGGNIVIYGTVDGNGISTIGASVGENPDDTKLTKAFAVLNAGRGLILVDWKSQLVLQSVAATGDIEVWRP
jgi:hypothetical protein